MADTCNCRVEGQTKVSHVARYPEAREILTAGCPVHSKPPCVFCEIVAGRAPAQIVEDADKHLTITPLGPVTPGHVLVIPKRHAEDFTTDLKVTADVMFQAGRYAKAQGGEWNLITSKGVEATQSVFHFHVHLVPRRPGDGLVLPWIAQQHEETSHVDDADRA